MNNPLLDRLLELKEKILNRIYMSDSELIEYNQLYQQLATKLNESEKPKGKLSDLLNQFHDHCMLKGKEYPKVSESGNMMIDKLEKQILDYDTTKTVFIMCETPNCFALHEMSLIADRIQICHRVRKQGVRANWD